MLRNALATLLLITSVCAGQGATVPQPPRTGASGHVLLDHDSGAVLAALNADEPLAPASLTKLMTSYVAFKALDHDLIGLDDLVTISEKAWRTGGSRTFLEVGSRVSVATLLAGMIVQSGNDASIALAEHVAGSEEAFVELMNAYAVMLGMTNTVYKNSTGLPRNGHYSTARDLAVLARAIIHEFPNQYGWYSEREFTHNEIRQPNRNGLLWRDASVDGLKTGYTSAAGYCLVSSAKRDGMRLIAVVMGTPSQRARLDASQALLDYGFEFFETQKVLSEGERVGEWRVWKGDARAIPLGVSQDVFVTAPRGRSSALTRESVVDQRLIAPIAQNDSVGTFNVRYDDELMLSVPLVTLQAVEPAGFFLRLLDGLALWLE